MPLRFALLSFTENSIGVSSPKLGRNPVEGAVSYKQLLFLFRKVAKRCQVGSQ